MPRGKPQRVRPLDRIRRPALQAAGGARQHEDGAGRVHQRVAGRQRLLLRDAPLRPGQRRLREAHARAGSVRLHQLGCEGAGLRRDRPPGRRRRRRRLHHHRHRPWPRRERAPDDRTHQEKAAPGFRDRRQRRHARGGDRPGELGRGRDQGWCRPGQGLHHQAQDRVWHRRLAALGAQVVRARGNQAHHRGRRHPPPRRHRQERALSVPRW